MANELWDPFEQINKFRKEMEKTFEDFWNRGKAALATKEDFREPAIDIKDKKKEIEVIAELPGVDKKDIKINIEEDRVEISAETKKEKEEKKKGFYRKEISTGKFYRAFSLPAIVDPNKAKAKFTNGVLKLDIPKVKQLPKKRKTLSLK
ncbi:MAG TPA: Hsp20/alpha crystallin family protein [Candidatus Woesearchaeota archaeon]|nr:MAG: Hsp20/alpha crystallin family protein [Candidatus Woesearchaeota archaeon]HDD70762.1 Hsp20/alpha crystallin family protein [Candidatus Woesearchaeota archaeon]